MHVTMPDHLSGKVSTQQRRFFLTAQMKEAAN
jgi:hypothetical protein